MICAMAVGPRTSGARKTTGARTKAIGGKAAHDKDGQIIRVEDLPRDDSAIGKTYTMQYNSREGKTERTIVVEDARFGLRSRSYRLTKPATNASRCVPLL